MAEKKGNGVNWTTENDRKLLLHVMNRPNLKPADHDQLVTIFPGATRNSIAVRLSKLRVEQRKAYDALGWALPEAQSARTVGPRKKITKNLSLALPKEENAGLRKRSNGAKEEVKSDNGEDSDERSQSMTRKTRMGNEPKRRRVDVMLSEDSLEDDADMA
ncbi:uncharacterized protein K441DRAFT_695751 [Cenococcum geophilum 1.58]|uniref:uncharacterized protein n=1 Tax=Cenococcum geophilum 1.58 TaxID=794803 RepID=UPI00358F924A|nr:hypothetical protein K441DRAFT_695751 [Cenococcum geophilum 1.58]